jgi:3',5'-cyclic AMP phosphodiesterase CpdA
VYQALNTTGWLGKVFGVIGNHDIFAGGWNYFKQYWGPSSYTFDVANSRFIVLDTGDATVGAPQLAWLKTELKKTQPRNTFILSHYAPWIPGIQTYLRLSDENESVQLLKIAESFHVKGWFSGHYHSYIKSRVNNLDVVIAGGLGTRMPPINYNFYVQVSVNSDTISYAIKRVD